MYKPKYLPMLKENSVSLSDANFTIVHFNKYRPYDTDEADPLHVHPYLEIFLNISSDVSFLINNNLYPVPIGSAVISRPDNVHMGIFHKSATHEYMCIWIDADFASPIFSFINKDNFTPLFSFDEETKKQLISLAFSLLDACKSNASQLKKTCYLLRILSIFENKQTTYIKELHIPEPLQKILDDIQNNFSQIGNVNDILNAHFVSSATLTRWFRKYLHSSPREYLESVRLSNASLLLKKGFTVTEACMRSGFSDCSRFIVLFKKKFGETPFKYKTKSFTNTISHK